jgi:hypothetical protein
MRKPPQLMRVAAAAAALLVSVAVFKRYMPYRPSDLALKQPPAVILTMEDTYLVGLGSKGKLWSLKARKVEMSQDRSTTTLTGIREGRIFDNGKPVLKVDAGTARYDIYFRNLQLGGGISVRSSTGERISGPGAIWNAGAGVLQSTGPVTVETGWSKLTANSLTLDVGRREMSLEQVRMRVNLRQAEKLLSGEDKQRVD